MGRRLLLRLTTVQSSRAVMANGVFVTGTDTGVGKTYVSTLALRILRSVGENAGVMKPVETGCAVKDGDLIARDAVFLAKTAGVGDDISSVAPYRFKTPVAPLVAARMEGVTIQHGRIREAFLTLLTRHSFVLVEGAGGLLVPITESYDMSDLAAELGLPVLVVAASRLGALNHALLTLEACRSRGLDVAGVVLNSAEPGSDEARRTNGAVLREIVPEPVVELAHGAGAGAAGGLRELLRHLPAADPAR